MTRAKSVEVSHHRHVRFFLPLHVLTFFAIADRHLKCTSAGPDSARSANIRAFCSVQSSTNHAK